LPEAPLRLSQVSDDLEAVLALAGRERGLRGLVGPVATEEDDRKTGREE
jgi:hypothetical protein